MILAMFVKVMVTLFILGGIYTCVQNHFEDMYETKLQKKADKRDAKREKRATSYQEKADKRNEKIKKTESIEDKVEIYINSTR